MVSFIISNFQKFQSVILVLIPQEVNDVHCCPSLFWGYSLVQLITAESAVLTFLNVFHTIYKFPNVLQRYSSIAIIWQFTHSFMKYKFFFHKPHHLDNALKRELELHKCSEETSSVLPCLALPPWVPFDNSHIHSWHFSFLTNPITLTMGLGAQVFRRDIKQSALLHASAPQGSFQACFSLVW